MFCLRSWLPLLFIPTNASPIFILIFFTCTYFLNRPCVYCSLLLLILFASSCQWSDHCFLGDAGKGWFEGRGVEFSTPSQTSNGTVDVYEGGNATMRGYGELVAGVAAVANETARMVGSVLGREVRETLGVGTPKGEWTGLGMGWLRTALGKREWRVPCLDVYVRL